jgi:hypothetical protein
MSRHGLLVCAIVGSLLLGAGAARAQGAAPTPWAPAGLDSMRLWGLEAHALLDAAQSDSIGPNESRAFGLLDRMTRRYFQALGPYGMRGARGILAIADSLKLDVEMAQDANLPQFVVVTYFNTKFAGYGSWTSLFWWRGDDLMKQSILLEGGRNIQMAVWWAGNDLGPYEMGLVDYRRSGDPREGSFTMLRISRQADFWGAVQTVNKTIDLGGPGPARFVDLDNDGVPELAHWAASKPDPRFVANTNLPPILSERTWRRTELGFQLLDRRTVPTPFSTFVLFLKALESGQVGLARSLVATPAVYTRAMTLKLGTFRAPASWRAAEPAPGERWAASMRFAYGEPPRLDKAIDVRMKEVEGHWLIDVLTPLSVAPPPAPAPKRASARSTR